MEVIDNVSRTVKEDLIQTIQNGSKVSIAAAYFSVYAYQELKNELNKVDYVNFIFTSPTFVNEQNSKTQKEFYIPKLNRERSLYGTEFEVKLKNELTQKAIAKECADWIRRKVKFKSNITNEIMTGFLNVDDHTYFPLGGFTTVDLGCERGNMVYYPVQKSSTHENGHFYLNLFNELWNDKKKLSDVTDEVIDQISEAYKENEPQFIYFFALYNIFSEFLKELSEDELPNDATGFKHSKIWNTLYNFQKDAAYALINKLEKYNGCILADSVGLGKTFTALAVIKYYENRNKSVLVLCPKKLSENWNTYKSNYINNPIAEDRLRYDVLYHTDLSRNGGHSNGINLEMINWGNYDLLVIDESHNFRNGGEFIGDEGKENRYLRLLNKVIRAGVKTKVLMLSATPVNNRFLDLKNQLALAYEGDPELINDKLDTEKSIDEIFRQAQMAFNDWSTLSQDQKSTETLLNKLSFDFFEVLDSVTIARSRKHIEKYYDTQEIGGFPERLKPISKRPALTDLPSSMRYDEIYEELMSLNLSIYTPSKYIMPSRLKKYINEGVNATNLTQKGREEGIRRLMSINLLKRLESSVYSFRLTIERILNLIDDTLDKINSYKSGEGIIDLTEISSSQDFDEDDLNKDYFSVGKRVRIDLNDMDYLSWSEELKKDKDILVLVNLMMNDITAEHDKKLQSLFHLIDEKIKNPINPGNKKLLIFTAFADTADYLYDNVSRYVMDKHNLHTAQVTGTVEGRSTIKLKRSNLNTVLTLFSPESKGRRLLTPETTAEIDILIATDCISEGQNLQDCDYLVNYDIHWNPVRIIQRFGRIDRIGSRNKVIQLVNFWPDIDLDEYINLKGRVETRMKISILVSTGDDNLISPEEKGDLEYRREQLQRLQEEVVDIEDMNSGVSIMDLGLNEYRMDLLEYMNQGISFEKTPTGLHAVVGSKEGAEPGVIFILRNIEDSVNKDNRNRIHPFYMVYVSNTGAVVCDYLNPKRLLDTMRFLARDETEPINDLYKAFNQETNDGKNMGKVSQLLSDAINSIIDTKEKSDIDSLFSSGGTSALLSHVSGLDDFELICFFVVR